jgi:hypothetical protein
MRQQFVFGAGFPSRGAARAAPPRRAEPAGTLPHAGPRCAARLGLAGLCVLAAAGCAGDPVGDDATRGQSRPAGGSGRVGSGPVAGDGSGGDFGNGSGMTPPPSGGSFTGSIPPPPLPQGERELVTMDLCGSSGVAADVVARLTDPAVAAGSGRLLYPYDSTVFPLGLTAPILQWDAPTGGSAVMLHLTSMFLDYRVCVTLSSPTDVAIPQDAWELAGEQSLGAADPLSVEIVVYSGGSAQKLPTLTVLIAIAKLKGAVYSNTYGSALATQMGAVGGVVMRILPGQPTPDVFLTAGDPLNCIGCHAVSADGSRMVAEIHGQPGTFEGPSASYDLGAVGTAVNPPAIRSDLRRAGFAALYPDGSVYVTTGRTQPGPIGALPGATPGNVPGTFGPEESKLFDTNTGAEIPGSGIEPYAYMPTFAVDGSKIVFTQMDTSGATGGHALMVMDFDRATNKFSNPREIFRDATKYVGWPFFMPDVVEQRVEGEVTATPPPPRGKRVVFALGDTPDFVTQDQPLGLLPHPSDLWWVDVETGMAAPLNNANGLDPSGAPNTPYGERDAHKHYIPTVSPVAAGGYFWMFFSSKRNYGNLFIADPPEVRAEGKKIWVAAIDINAAPGTDPSHPAFYLPGQELESGNIRAFAALEPCRDNGAACESGIDCCCGFCIEGACACKPQDRCAEIDEACVQASDCCDPAASCIGGFCGYIVVQ